MLAQQLQHVARPGLSRASPSPVAESGLRGAWLEKRKRLPGVAGGMNTGRPQRGRLAPGASRVRQHAGIASMLPAVAEYVAVYLREHAWVYADSWFGQGLPGEPEG